MKGTRLPLGLLLLSGLLAVTSSVVALSTRNIDFSYYHTTDVTTQASLDF